MQQLNISMPGIYAGLSLIALVLATGCTDSARERDTTADGVGTTSSAVAATQPPRSPRQTSGVVKSVQTAGVYTYLEVDIGGEHFWLATLATRVQPGQKISWRDYALMQNFSSKTLGRKFETILFVERIFGETARLARIQHGVVEESLNAGGYSFLRVDQNGNSLWLAAPEMQLRAGQRVNWRGGAPMRNFTSRSLNRKFDEILFVDAVHPS